MNQDLVCHITMDVIELLELFLVLHEFQCILIHKLDYRCRNKRYQRVRSSKTHMTVLANARKLNYLTFFFFLISWYFIGEIRVLEILGSKTHKDDRNTQDYCHVGWNRIRNDCKEITILDYCSGMVLWLNMNWGMYTVLVNIKNDICIFA